MTDANDFHRAVAKGFEGHARFVRVGEKTFNAADVAELVDQLAALETKLAAVRAVKVHRDHTGAWLAYSEDILAALSSQPAGAAQAHVCDPIECGCELTPAHAYPDGKGTERADALAALDKAIEATGRMHGDPQPTAGELLERLHGLGFALVRTAAAEARGALDTRPATTLTDDAVLHQIALIDISDTARRMYGSLEKASAIYGRPIPVHDYRLHITFADGAEATMHHGATADDVAAYLARRALDAQPEEPDLLMEALGGLRVQAWFCPDDHSHGWPGCPGPTVEWRDNVAHCLKPGCGKTSARPAGNTDGQEARS